MKHEQVYKNRRRIALAAVGTAALTGMGLAHAATEHPTPRHPVQETITFGEDDINSQWDAATKILRDEGRGNDDARPIVDELIQAEKEQGVQANPSDPALVVPGETVTITAQIPDQHK